MHLLSHPGQLAKSPPTLLPQQPVLGSSVVLPPVAPPPPAPICGCQIEGCTPSKDCLKRREAQPPLGVPLPFPFLPPECRPSIRGATNAGDPAIMKACTILATAALTTTVIAQSIVQSSSSTETSSSAAPSSTGKKIVEISVGAVRHPLASQLSNVHRTDMAIGTSQVCSRSGRRQPG